MLCRSTSTGVLSTLLPTVSSHLQTGFNSFTDQNERSSPDLYQHQDHAHVSTARSSLQSPASQRLKPAADFSRSGDGAEWDFEACSSSVGQWPGRVRKVQSENDLRSLWRSSSGSAATFAAAGSFNGSQSYEDEPMTALERRASERESVLLEIAESSEDNSPTGGSVASEELRDVPSIASQGGFWNESLTRRQQQVQFGYDQPASSGSHQDVMMSAVEASSRENVMERSGYASSSQNETGGPMMITDLGFGGGSVGSGRGGVSGGRGGSGGGYGDSNGVEAQYRRMLEADPGNPLLLRNYARFLHEVKREPLKAEPYYERAILANPGDGEVLGQYAQLIWEVYKDEDRAGDYFDQALQACPDDCYINAAYASFLWSSEADDGEEAEALQDECNLGYIHTMPPVYGAAVISA